MFKYIKYIAEGWFFEIFQFFIKLKYRKPFEERLKICQRCPSNINECCKECGCFIKAKTKVKELSCPYGKWTSLL